MPFRRLPSTILSRSKALETANKRKLASQWGVVYVSHSGEEPEEDVEVD